MRVRSILSCFLLSIAVFTSPLSAQPQWNHHTIDSTIIWLWGIWPGDIDNDGDVDILAAGGDYVAWFEHDGSLGFTQRNIYTSGNNFKSCALADLDGDGFLDAAANENFGDKVAWFHNDGTPSVGNWDRYEIISGYDAPGSVRAADLNQDGYIDLATTAGGSTDDFSIWYNDGTPLNGGWDREVLPVPRHPEGFELNDLDDDGDIDIVYGIRPYYVGWLESTGAGWVDHNIPNSVGGAYVYVVDVDADGDKDIVATDPDAEAVDWWESDGSYTDNGWTNHVIATGYTSPGALSCLDVDGDSDVDVIINDYYYNDHVDWCENDGTPGNGVWDVHVLSSGLGDYTTPWGLDIDLDGDTDILCTVGYFSSPGFIYLFEQAGTWEPFVRVLSPNGGEVWHRGFTATIRWHSDFELPVRIELRRNWELERIIAPLTENDGVFEWEVPYGLPTDDRYRVRVLTEDGEEFDVSDADFTIDRRPTITLIPENEPVVIPSGGGGYWYWLELYNPLPGAVRTTVWSELMLPDGSYTGPIAYQRIWMPPLGLIAPEQPLGQYITASAPPGQYRQVVRAGDYPAIEAEGWFEFTKLGSIEGPVDYSAFRTWLVEPDGWDFGSDSDEPAADLYQDKDWKPAMTVAPNPFNAATTISLKLPQATDVQIAIYNVQGRQVATVSDGEYSAGVHVLSVDASQLASGVYFVQLHAGDVKQTEKVLLVR